MRKIGIILTITIVLFSSVFIQPKKTEAAFFLAIPAAAPYAYTAAVTAWLAATSVGTAGVTWFNNNHDTILQTANESWGLMSENMKENFITSMDQAKGYVEFSGDFIKDLINKLVVTTTVPGDLGITVDESTKRVRFGQMSDTSSYYFDRLTTLKIYDSSNVLLYEGNTKSLYGAGTIFIDGTWDLILRTVGSGGTGEFASYSFNKIRFADREVTTNERSDMATWASNLTLTDMFVYLTSLGYTLELDGFNVPTLENSLELKNINEQLESILASNGGKVKLGVSPEQLAIPTTSLGVPLQYDSVTGNLKLSDGTTYTGDVTWTAPTVSIKEVEGANTAVLETDLGAVNVVTGEKVQAGTGVNTGELPSTTGQVDKMKKESESLGVLLTTRFPFSLPWDFMAMMGLLYAEPMTPEWEIRGTDKYPINFDVSFAFLNPYIGWFRGFILLGFVMSVIFMHSRFMGGSK